MSRQLSTAWLVAVALFVAFAGLVFVVLNQAFGGPSPMSGASQRVRATVPDSQGLVTKSLVLVRGVRVGEVVRRELRGREVDIEFGVDPTETQVYRDATVRIGHRTLFGEAYVQLDPGHPGAGPLPTGARLPKRSVLPTQRLDDALEAFDAKTRGHIRSLNATGAKVDADPAAREELNRTIGGLGDTLVELRSLEATLDGQHGALRDFVSDSRTVVDELGRRQDAISTLVTAAADTGGALTADDEALQRAIAGTGALLRSSRGALDAVRPLIPKAAPVVTALDEAAPDVTVALTQLRPVARSAGTLVRGLPAFNRVALPVLRRAQRVGRLAEPALGRLEPVLRDLVPTVRYLADYRREVLGFIEAGAAAARRLGPDGTASNTGTLAELEDFKRRYDKDGFAEQGVDGAPYGWGRFFVDNTALAGPGGLATNPYPRPMQPYTTFSGKYPRLLPEPRVSP